MTPLYIISASWVVFIIVWFIGSLGAKRTQTRAWGSLWMRVLIALGIFALISTPQLHNYFDSITAVQVHTPLAWAGALLVILGAAFAIWARAYLGSNWGMPMTLRQNHELVTSGPYKYVRHPIYTGVLLAMFGSSLAIVWWALFFVLFGTYFIYSAYAEEKTLLAQFPDAYPAYKAHTKMLIPFIF